MRRFHKGRWSMSSVPWTLSTRQTGSAETSGYFSDFPRMELVVCLVLATARFKVMAGCMKVRAYHRIAIGEPTELLGARCRRVLQRGAIDCSRAVSRSQITTMSTVARRRLAVRSRTLIGRSGQIWAYVDHVLSMYHGRAGAGRPGFGGTVESGPRGVGVPRVVHFGMEVSLLQGRKNVRISKLRVLLNLYRP